MNKARHVIREGLESHRMCLFLLNVLQPKTFIYSLSLNVIYAFFFFYRIISLTSNFKWGGFIESEVIVVQVKPKEQGSQQHIVAEANDTCDCSHDTSLPFMGRVNRGKLSPRNV